MEDEIPNRRGALEDARRADSLCDRFEAAWIAGSRPSVGEFLAAAGYGADTAPAELVRLLTELAKELAPGASGAGTVPAPGHRAAPEVTAEHEPVIGHGAPVRDAQEARPAPSASAVPGFEIVGEIGSGAMGVVYEARQCVLNRTVALKMVLRNGCLDSRAVVRFLGEAEALAAVKHPNVVEVYQYGDGNGCPYLAMEYVPGGTLADRLRACGRLEPHAAARLIEQLALGAHAAHGAGIVHRDIKPSNVLLGPSGEPKLADFGLAKRAASDLTPTQVLLGTPAYLAPEQASGEAKFVGPAADVWALGVILYECLTGARPFAGATTEEVLARVSSHEPAPMGRAVPRDLERICRACLAKDPADRYQSAADLAADLARFRRGEPISLRAAGWAERALKWARRKPTQAALVGALFTAAALGAFGATVAWLLHETIRERESAESAKSDAVTARAESERDRIAAIAAHNGEKAAREQAEGALRAKEIAEKRLAVSEYGNAVQVALQHWRDNNVVAARNVLKRTKPELRGWEWYYVNNLCRPDPGTLTLTGHPNGVSAAVWHPDGSRIVTTSADHAPKVWDAKTGTVAFRLTGHTSWITGAKYSADGSRIVTTSIDNTAKVWDAKGGDALLTLNGHKDWVLAAAFSKDGTRIATGGNEKIAKVWDAKTGDELLAIKGHTKAVVSVAFAPDGARVLTVSQDRTAKVWDAKTGEERLTIKSAAHPVLAADWSPDGAHVLTGGEDGTARVWSATTGAEVLVLRGHANAVSSVSYSSDGALVVTGSRDNSAKIWDARTGTERHTLRGHTGSVWSASFSSDRRRVLTGSHDQTARVWDANAGADALALNGHTGAVRSVAFDPEAARVVTGSDDASAKVWDAKSGSELLTLKHAQMGAFWAVSFGSDGSYVRTASLPRFGFPGPSRGDEPAALWDAKTGRIGEIYRGFGLNTLMQPVGPGEWRMKELPRDELAKRAERDARTPGEWRAVRASNDGSLKVFDPFFQREFVVYHRHASFGRTTELSVWNAQRTRVVRANRANTASIADGNGGAVVATLDGHTECVTAAAWSADGARVATGGADRLVKIWDAATGIELLSLKGHTGPVHSVAFSRDGARLVTGSEDATARVWFAPR